MTTKQSVKARLRGGGRRGTGKPRSRHVRRPVSVAVSSGRNAELFANVVEQTGDAVLITDEAGQVEYVNPAFETITGYSRSEILGRSPAVLKSGRHDEAFYRELWGTIRAGKIFRATITNRAKNGDLFLFRQTITPIKDRSGRITHFVSVAKDITDLEKATRLESRLRLAREVQQLCYPKVAPRAGEFDIAGSASLSDVTGGDYFDYITLPDGTLGIAIGDASGHGFDSSLLMVEARAYLRSLGSTLMDPGEILTTVNRLLTGDIPVGNFVTLLFLALDPTNDMLRYASAGHVSGYVVDAAGLVRNELKSGGTPLGLFPGQTYVTVEVPRLLPGDVIALMTDGVTEAENGEETSFGWERALEAIRYHVHAPAVEIVERILETLRAFCDGCPQADDVTVVICKRSAAAQKWEGAGP